jgi:TrbC/VIRB2 pilin
LIPSIVFAQIAVSPWERAASNLERTFTGPLARSLALVAIVIGGLIFMFESVSGLAVLISQVFRGGQLGRMAPVAASCENGTNCRFEELGAGRLREGGPCPGRAQ